MARKVSLTTIFARETPGDSLNYLVHSDPAEFLSAVRNRKIKRETLVSLAASAQTVPIGPRETALSIATKIVQALRPIAVASPLADHNAWRETNTVQPVQVS